MGIFDGIKHMILTSDRDINYINKVREALREYRRKGEEASEEERKMAEEAVAFLRRHDAEE